MQNISRIFHVLYFLIHTKLLHFYLLPLMYVVVVVVIVIVASAVVVVLSLLLYCCFCFHLRYFPF